MFQELLVLALREQSGLIQQYGDVFDIMASLPIDGKIQIHSELK